MRRIAGLIIVVAAVVFSVAALATDDVGWTIGAAAAALIGGVLATRSDNAADGLRTEVERLRIGLDTERNKVEVLEGELDKLAAAEQPVEVAADLGAGSFDRKFDDTQGIPRARTGPQLLSDPETNLFSEAYFRVALDARIASARRHLRPVAVALLQVTDDNDGSGAAQPVKVAGAIRQTLRDADTACRVDDGSFALILEDTPENGAVWTVERVRRNLAARHGHHTLWAGIACYPAHAFSTDELLEQARVALDAAREWKQDRIEVATAD